ncbi:MAG: hypothetical protein Q8M40_04730, partial [Legionella sp.]|nr:hypothetical protein [Legionella sp.]
MNATSLYLYSRLQGITSLHAALPLEDKAEKKLNPHSEIKAIWATSVFSSLWKNPTEYAAIAKLQNEYQTRNFTCSILGKRIAYLETPKEVTQILNAKTSLGWSYQHFSSAAGLHKEFVAQNKSHDNVHWKHIHNAMGDLLKKDATRIKSLIEKHVINCFLKEKNFELDLTFDHFFTGFWAEYLLGSKLALASYQETRQHVLEAMNYCFYNNSYKAFDPTGLTSYLSSFAVRGSLNKAREQMKQFIQQASSDSLIKRFESSIRKQYETEQIGISINEIDEMLLDILFDFFLIPDFLENVLYETLVNAITEHADLHVDKIRKQMYERGRDKGYLFPIRA